MSKVEKMEMKMGDEPKLSVAEKDEGPAEYEIEEAANTLMKAEKIRNDKKLMPHVHKHLKNKKSAIESIAGLRDKANAYKYDEEMDDED